MCPKRTNALGSRSSSARQKGSASSERRKGTQFPPHDRRHHDFSPCLEPSGCAEVSAANSARNSSTYSSKRLRSIVTGKNVPSLSPQRLSHVRMRSNSSGVIWPSALRLVGPEPARVQYPKRLGVQNSRDHRIAAAVRADRRVAFVAPLDDLDRRVGAQAVEATCVLRPLDRHAVIDRLACVAHVASLGVPARARTRASPCT